MFRGGEAAATKTMIFAMVTKTEGIEEVQYIQIKKENQKMKNITKSIILSAAVAALAALLLKGCRREKTAQAEGAPAESSRTAAVDSTRMEMELIEWVGAGVELDR